MHENVSFSDFSLGDRDPSDGPPTQCDAGERCPSRDLQSRDGGGAADPGHQPDDGRVVALSLVLLY